MLEYSGLLSLAKVHSNLNQRRWWPWSGSDRIAGNQFDKHPNRVGATDTIQRRTNSEQCQMQSYWRLCTCYRLIYEKELQGYLIRAIGEDGTEITEVISQHNLSTIIRGLNPNFTYNITVQTITTKGESIPSDIVTVTTPSRGIAFIHLTSRLFPRSSIIESLNEQHLSLKDAGMEPTISVDGGDEGSTTLTVISGSDVDLLCSGGGEPKPVLQWRRVDHRIEDGVKFRVENDTDNQALMLRILNITHNAIFECKADNGEGVATWIVNLIIIRKLFGKFYPIHQCLRASV